MAKRGSTYKTSDEKKHMSAVAELGCAICRRLGHEGTPAELHHIRSGQGWGRPSNYFVIPLCPRHHRGDEGIHGLGTKGFPKHYGFTEQELLEDVYRLLGKTLPVGNK
jgi:hypothetical protein